MKTLALLFAAAFALAGCSTPELYYRLSADGPLPSQSSGMSLGVGPVELPDYIDRGELVFQSSETRFEVPYEQRWAGSLRDSSTRAIGVNLARRLGTSNLHTYPWLPGTRLDYQVRISVNQFHARSGGDAILEVRWTIEDGKNRVLSRNSGTFREPVKKDGYEGIVAAESRLLSQLSEAVAADFPGR